MTTKSGKAERSTVRRLTVLFIFASGHHPALLLVLVHGLVNTREQGREKIGNSAPLAHAGGRGVLGVRGALNRPNCEMNIEDAGPDLALILWRVTCASASRQAAGSLGVLDQQDFIPRFIECQLIDQARGNQDPEAPGS